MTHVDTIQALAQGFFESLGIEFSGLEVTEQDADGHIYSVKITSPDSLSSSAHMVELSKKLRAS